MESVLGVIASLLLGFVPIFCFAYVVYWTDRYEKEPLVLLVGVFLWGVVVAAGGAFVINTILGIGVLLATGSEIATELATGILIAPVVEECLKGFAVLVVFLLFRSEFDSILDGIVYAAIAALGFAAVENSYYIFSMGYAEQGWAGLIWLAFVRVVLVGWQHPFYTAFTGIGLAVGRLNRHIVIKLAAPVAGLLTAMLAHALHNTLAGILPGLPGLAFGTLLDWSGWLAMVAFVGWAMYREQRWIIRHLREEVNLGVISPDQYRTACSAWRQTFVRLQALFSGRFGATHRFYQVTAELAFKKEQLATLGNESNNLALVQRYRSELSRLGALALA